MEKLECQKINYKNFNAEKDKYLQADSAAGMKKLMDKFGDNMPKMAGVNSKRI